VSVTREELAAFADGELEAERAREVAAAVAADPALADEVQAHRLLRERLGTHFAPIISAPVPERLTAALRPPAQVIDLSEARARRMRRVARWSWVAGPALAASLALALFLPRGGDYAQGPLEAALETQLVAQQSGAEPTRVLLSFRDDGGALCRAFAGQAQSGIACRDGRGWRLRMKAAGAAAQAGEYRMAGAPAAEVLEAAQGLAAGPALDAAEEARARARHWR
jgi:hypothetical protein